MKPMSRDASAEIAVRSNGSVFGAHIRRTHREGKWLRRVSWENLPASCDLGNHIDGNKEYASADMGDGVGAQVYQAVKGSSS